MVLGLIEKAKAVLCGERLFKIRPDELLVLADDSEFSDGRFAATFKKIAKNTCSGQPRR